MNALSKRFMDTGFKSVLAIVVILAAALPAKDANAPPAWPRTFEKEGNTVLLYQPQVDEWKDYKTIKFRAAIALAQKDSNQTEYGVLAVKAATMVDHDARMVLMTNLDAQIHFPGMDEAKAGPLIKLTKDMLPKRQYLNVSLDHVLAYMHADEKTEKVNVNLDPPPIYYSNVPAILVIYIGQPQFKPVKDTQLMFAVNTNWAVLMDMKTSQYYLLNSDQWLTASDPLNGPWKTAKELPAEFSKLPAGSNWDEVRKQIPGSQVGNAPKVFTSDKPAELIVTQGPPSYSPVPPTHLMYVSNPKMPLFLDNSDKSYYYLVAGRWFRAKDVNGPWSAASSDLPQEFAKIPSDSPIGYVLASVPKTQEAEDAVILASVPHKATVNIKEAKLEVTYDGQPKFIPIESTQMSYAVNTSYQVIDVGDSYYCCYQGVWFMSAAGTGPWAVCASVPDVIYTIPPSSPVYNVTYVRVYDSTPSTVEVGYTGGYSGEYVASTGALMFGAGMVTGALIAGNNDYWYGYSPSYYSYGCAASYSYANGGYYRGGGAYYGPNGGAGWGSAYNPATGTWARAGYAYGPEGARWGGQAYNPFTNTYAAHTGGTNGYQSWGKTAVSQDGKWAQAGHVSGPAGSAGYAETSTGRGVAGVSTAGGTKAAKTESGDVYAGRDGNVYKKSDGQWQKYEGGGNWENTQWNKPAAGTQRPAQTRPQGQEPMAQTRPAGEQAGHWGQQENAARMNQESSARNRGEMNSAASWQSRSGGFEGGRGGGSFHGGRR